jgi:hypothetical protein
MQTLAPSNLCKVTTICFLIALIFQTKVLAKPGSSSTNHTRDQRAAMANFKEMVQMETRKGKTSAFSENISSERKPWVFYHVRKCAG